ncbi:MAG TPA: histidine kinase [Spirochaeta sp.]|nr:histidine kinase [Spirochaeta sp.]
MNLGELVKKKGAEVFSVKAKNTVATALVAMNEKHIGAMLVLDEEGKLAGIITERDLLMVCHKCGEVKYVHELMTAKDKLFCLNPKDSIQDAMKLMTSKKVRHLPILEGDALVGIVSIGDIVKELLEEVEQENKYLNEYITGQNI